MFIIFKKNSNAIIKEMNEIKNNQKSCSSFTDCVSVLQCICLAHYSEKVQTCYVLNFTVELAHAKGKQDFYTVVLVTSLKFHFVHVGRFK